MNSQDLLNAFLLAAVLIIAGCSVLITYYLVKALKSITNLVDNLDDTTQGLKDKIHLKALAAIPAILLALVSKVIKKRG